METMTDFRKSTFTWLTREDSHGRFSIESILEYDDQTFYLGSAVMACNMYKVNNLIINPSYLYQLGVSENSYHIFRTSSAQISSEDSAGKISERFKKLIISDIKSEVELIGKSEIKDALLNDKYLLAKVNVNTNYNKSYTLTFPIKHINYSEKEEMFQAETGMVAVPSHKNDHKLQLAFVAFNNLDLIEMNILSDHPDRSFNIFKTDNCSTSIFIYNK